VKKTSVKPATRAFEKAANARRPTRCVLKLYVAGASDRSRQAVLRARQLCEAEFKNNFELKVIDVYQQPILARDGQIIATPTLVRELPKPVRRLIGNLSNTAALFVGLDLNTRSKTRK
jgi:circadian clock protein KaiB